VKARGTGGGSAVARLVFEMVIVSLAFNVVTTSPARADSYDSLIVRGVAARDRALETGSIQDWQQALDLFAMAADLHPTKEAKFEFAEAAGQLHLDDEACAAYGEALELGLRGKAEQRAHAFIESHAGQMAGLAVEGPPGTTVYITDRRRGVLPLAGPILVSAGMLRVRLVPPRFREWEATISVEAGKTTPLRADLIPETDGAPAPGSMVLKSSTTERVAPPARWAWPVLAGGGAATLAGAAAIAVTTVLRDQQQRSLERDCVVLQGSQCVSTTADKQTPAQAIANRIATLDGERWAAIGVTAVGSAAVSVALLQLLRSGSHRDPSGGAGVHLTKTEMVLDWQGEF
jgi:hypothetical protein